MTQIPTAPLTLAQAARECGLSPVTLRVQIRNGRIRATKLGRDWFVGRKDLRDYLKNRHNRS